MTESSFFFHNDCFFHTFFLDFKFSEAYTQRSMGICKKNDDSVKEAPAYCRSFLDGLNGLKGRAKTPYFYVLKCFVMICNVL